MVADRPDPQATRDAALALLERHWREPGYTCPNAVRYPWMWLWDSCFHSIVWAELGRPERALTELLAGFAFQDSSGFVPHMTYYGDLDSGSSFWGRPATSSITQPPMYGHAIAELSRRGVDLPKELLDRATIGLRFLLDHRRRSPAGLVELVHPWESGADDSPRWDHFCQPWSRDAWRVVKGDLMESVERNGSGAPIGNPAFAVGSASFTALVAFNAWELSRVTGDNGLAADAEVVIGALDRRWDGHHRTWVDDGVSASTSGRARTMDSLLGLLVTRRPDARDAVVVDLLDPMAFGGPFGPAGVHRGEPSFDASSYWRGPSWPQLTYLLVEACRNIGRDDAARALGDGLLAGATISGWAEYWDADSGIGGGAAPQSWTTLAILVPGA